MLKSDAGVTSGHLPVYLTRQEYVIKNIENITIEAVSEIQKEVDPLDTTSLVFLLYDTPETALERLILLQRLSRDIHVYNTMSIEGKSLNLLQDWAQREQSRPTWRLQFLEALTICQLFSVVRKLGLHVPAVKAYFQYDKDNFKNIYIDPTKRLLYKLCETIDSSDLIKFKKTLLTYDINTAEYETCELVLLELMSQKFITTLQSYNWLNYKNNIGDININVKYEKLARILDNFNDLQEFTIELRQLEALFNYKNVSITNNNNFNFSTPKPSTSTTIVPSKEKADNTIHHSGFNEIFNMLEEFNMNDEMPENLKSDTTTKHKTSYQPKDAYMIKNYKRLGVCYIINQENFHLSKESIECGIKQQPLDNRKGSMCDKKALEMTMTGLNFEVITHEDLDHKKMFDYIKDIIQYRVHHDDSIFVLCILSHGIRGHVYAADTVKVKIESIQNILDSEDALNLRGLPKLLIIQACQVDDDMVESTLVADAPMKYHLRKSDFLIYWATAPEFEAYRDESQGSIFIQILCHVLKLYAKKEHLYDIFTKVNDLVLKVCSLKKCNQVPIFESTLRKKLFLH